MRTFENLNSGHLRRYTRYPARQGWTAGIIRTYYAYVSAFCGWTVREGHLAENVAQRRNATNPFPTTEDTKAATSKRGPLRIASNPPISSANRPVLQSTTSVKIEGLQSKTCRDRALVYLLS